MKTYLDNLKEKIALINICYTKKLKHCSYIKLTKNNIIFYDGEIFLIMPLENPIIENEAILEADLLINLFKKVSKSDFDYHFSETSLSFYGKRKLIIELPFLDNIDFPSIKFPEFWNEIPENFKEAIDFCSFSISSTLSSGVLSCFYIGEMIVVSSDNFRATKYYLTASFDFDTKETSILLTSDLYKRISKLSTTHYKITENNLFLSGSSPFDFFLALPVLDEKYPQELIDIFPWNKDGMDVEIITKEFKEMIERSTFLISEGIKQKEEYIELNFSKQEITCLSQRAKGTIMDMVKRDPSDNLFVGKINVDPHLLMKAFEKYNKMIINENYILFFDDKSEHIVGVVE